MSTDIDKRLELVKQQYEYERWKDRAKGGHASIKDLFTTDNHLHGWKLRSVREIPRAIPGVMLQSFWERGEDAPDSILRIDGYESESAAGVIFTLLQLLSRFQLPGMKYQDEAGFGDIAFFSDTNLVMLFAQTNLVFFIRNVGRIPVKVLDVARFIDDLVIKGYGDKDEV